MEIIVKNINLTKEVRFQTSRSGGKGGQNVNKVSTRVQLFFNVQDSVTLPDEMKEILLKKLANKITKDGEIIITSANNRTQQQNKKATIIKFIDLLEKALTPSKKRLKTKIPQEVKEHRLRTKKINSEKKRNRNIKIEF